MPGRRSISGWAQSQLGTAPGLDEIEAGLHEMRQIGAGRLAPFYLGLAAEAYARAGRPDDARTRLAQAFAALGESRDLAFVAELHQSRAVLGLRDGAGEDKAEWRQICVTPSTSRGSRKRGPSSSEPLGTSLPCWLRGANDSRLVSSSGLSTTGSRKVSRHQTYQEAKALIDKLRAL